MTRVALQPLDELLCQLVLRAEMQFEGRNWTEAARRVRELRDAWTVAELTALINKEPNREGPPGTAPDGTESGPGCRKVQRTLKYAPS
jgi:hypothetical protein